MNHPLKRWHAIILGVFIVVGTLGAAAATVALSSSVAANASALSDLAERQHRQAADRALELALCRQTKLYGAAVVVSLLAQRASSRLDLLAYRSRLRDKSLPHSSNFDAQLTRLISKTIATIQELTVEIDTLNPKRIRCRS